jgi:hypothetical protein
MQKIIINEDLWKNLQFKASYAPLAVQIFSLFPYRHRIFCFHSVETLISVLKGSSEIIFQYFLLGGRGLTPPPSHFFPRQDVWGGQTLPIQTILLENEIYTYDMELK